MELHIHPAENPEAFAALARSLFLQTAAELLLRAETEQTTPLPSAAPAEEDP